MFIFFSFSCYMNWSCYFVFIFHFLDSLFYYPIWIAIDVSKHFLKVSNFIFQVLAFGTHFEGTWNQCL